MIKFMKPVPPHLARDLVARVYAQIDRDFGALVEPFTLHSPSATLLAAVWSMCRETELTGSVDRDVKEAIASAVSRHNRCPYCVDAHAVMLHAAHNREAASLILYNQDNGVDERIRKIIQWTEAVRSPSISTPVENLPFTKEEAPEIIGTAVMYCYINRMVTILLGNSPLPFKVEKFAYKNLLLRIGSLFFRGAVNRKKAGGDSLTLLPEAPLPADLGWATGNPFTASAFAHMACETETAGKKYIPATLRSYAVTYAKEWQGGYPPISRSWVEPHVRQSPGPDQPTLRLILLTIAAPEQVDEKIIREFQAAQGGEDERLVSVLAWASFTAARRIGKWVAAGAGMENPGAPLPPTG